MDYTIKTYTEDGQELSQIQLVTSNSLRVFPADNSNPSYISFLRQLSEENPNDPHYLEWVESGNNPEDFWSQSEDFLDTSVSEVTEPKEEKEETPQEGES